MTTLSPKFNYPLMTPSMLSFWPHICLPPKKQRKLLCVHQASDQFHPCAHAFRYRKHVTLAQGIFYGLLARSSIQVLISSLSPVSQGLSRPLPSCLPSYTHEHTHLFPIALAVCLNQVSEQSDLDILIWCVSFSVLQPLGYLSW